MNLTNATLLRIDTPLAAGPGGDVAYSTGSPISIRVLQDEPTFSTKYVLGIVIAEATAVLFVSLALALGITFRPDQLVTVQIDGGSPSLFTVLYRRDRILPGTLSHYELYLKAL